MKIDKIQNIASSIMAALIWVQATMLLLKSIEFISGKPYFLFNWLYVLFPIIIFFVVWFVSMAWIILLKAKEW